jgi:hypothetical protein
LLPHLAALVCAAVVATFALCAPTSAAAASDGGCSLSDVSTSSQPACWKPYGANSVFNTELTSNPTLTSNSAAVINNMVSSGWSIDGSNSSFNLSPANNGTRPVFFATPSDPTMTIHCENAAGAGSCTGQNHINVAGARIHVPAGAQPFDNSDAHLTVIETATGAEYDFWEASISGSTISTAVAAKVNVATGSGLGSQGDAGAFGLTAGLVRPSELAAGHIDHALTVTVPCVNGSGSRGYVWPAVGGWGYPCGSNGSSANDNIPAMGQLLQLNMSDAQIQASGAPSWEKTIMTALAHYGAYVEDTNGTGNPGIDILLQAGSSWTDLGKSSPWGQFGSLSSGTPIPLGRFQVVAPCVPRGRCAGVAAGTGQAGGKAPGRAKHHKKHGKKQRHHKKHKKHHHKHKHHKKKHHKHQKKHHHKKHKKHKKH